MNADEAVLEWSCRHGTAGEGNAMAINEALDRICVPCRHSRESGLRRQDAGANIRGANIRVANGPKGGLRMQAVNPVTLLSMAKRPWIPAFAGMTIGKQTP